MNSLPYAARPSAKRRPISRNLGRKYSFSAKLEGPNRGLRGQSEETERGRQQRALAHTWRGGRTVPGGSEDRRSEEHTSELQSPYEIVCRLLLEKKNKNLIPTSSSTTRCSFTSPTRTRNVVSRSTEPTPPE